MKFRVLFSTIIFLSNTLVNANEMNEDEVITLENCQQPIQPISTVSFAVTSNAVIEKHSYKNGKPLTFWSETEVGTKKALTIKYNGKSIEKYSVELIGEYVESALLVNAKNEFYVCRDKE
ncbi:TPA: hypothetical protein RQK24_004532 [Vibrio vulnificus]|nr:hypothetical protein [Vibrio vulnificus]